MDRSATPPEQKALAAALLQREAAHAASQMFRRATELRGLADQLEAEAEALADAARAAGGNQ